MRFPVRSAAVVIVGMLATSAHAQTPSPQYPAPPLPQPGFATPPTPEKPPTPAAAPRAPAPQVDTGEIEQTTRARGAAIVNNGGTVIYQSPGVSTPAAAAYPARAVAPARLAIPPSLIVLGAKRLGGGLYYAVTGQCPTTRPVAVVPVTTDDFSTPPSAAPQRAALPQPQEVVVRVVHEQAPAYYPGPSASPQQVIAQPVKRWSIFHHNP